jgi:inner membrane protein involved in colicin E2 resistance
MNKSKNSTVVANNSLRRISWTVFALGTIAILYSICSEDEVGMVVGMMMFVQSAGVLFLTKSN